MINGPAILPGRLNGENHLDFLENRLPELLEDLPLAQRLIIWYMHDGAHPHYSFNVQTFLNKFYANT